MDKLRQALAIALQMAVSLQKDKNYPYITRCNLKVQEFFLRRMLDGIDCVEKIKTKQHTKQR